MSNTHKDRNGYPRWNESNRLVHRDVARNMHGSIEEGRVVHHKDGNKSNFRRSNLSIKSRSEHSSYHAKRRSR